LHTINLTGDKITTLEDIIKISESIFNKKSIVKEMDPYNISIRNPSNKRAKEIINWKPLISIEEGIKTLDKII